MTKEKLNEDVFDMIASAKKELIKIIAVSVIGGIISMVAFYYNTTNRLNNVEFSTNQLKAEQEKKAGVEDVKLIREDLREIKQVQKDIYLYMLNYKRQ
ncbi:MAG: hypothetical protein V4549_06430 [Bacteroidota bacterium]